CRSCGNCSCCQVNCSRCTYCCRIICNNRWSSIDSNSNRCWRRCTTCSCCSDNIIGSGTHRIRCGKCDRSCSVSEVSISKSCCTSCGNCTCCQVNCSWCTYRCRCIGHNCRSSIDCNS